jgi:hypothetical protein
LQPMPAQHVGYTIGQLVGLPPGQAGELWVGVCPLPVILEREPAGLR